MTKKILFFAIFVVLCAYFSVLAAPKYLGRDNVGNNNRRDIIIDGKYAYSALGSAGLSSIDLSDPTNPTVLDTIDISPGSTSCNAIAKSGNYIYAVSRVGAGNYTKTDFANGFEAGDADLSDGESAGSGNDDFCETALFSGGSAPAGATIVGNETVVVKAGDYSAKCSLTTSWSAYTTVTVTGGADNYFIYWVMMTNPQADLSGDCYTNRIEGGGDYCVRVNSQYRATNQWRLTLLIEESDSTFTAAIPSALFEYDTWYQVKIHYKVGDGVTTPGAGGAKAWYRMTEGAAWIETGAENYNLDTTGRTPDSLTVGVVNGGGVDGPWYAYYDDIRFSASDADLSEYEDEGYVSIVDVSDPTNITEVGTGLNVEYKPSGAEVSGNYLYVPSQAYGLQIYEILGGASTPTGLKHIAGYYKNDISGNPGGYDAHGLDIDSGILYGCNGSYGIYTLDISTPSAPTLLDIWDSEYVRLITWDCEKQGNYLFCGSRCVASYKTDPVSDADKTGLLVIDVTNPESLSQVALIELSDNLKLNHPVNGETGNGADPNPQIISLHNNKLYASNGWKGIVVWNISMPTSPVFVEAFDLTTDGSQFITSVDVDDGVLVAGGTLISSAGEPINASTDPDFYVYKILDGGVKQLGF